MTVEVEVTRTGDANDLVRALSDQGLAASAGESGRILVEADNCTHVEHVLEAWAAERGLPFVPQCLDGTHVVLAPPGS